MALHHHTTAQKKKIREKRKKKVRKTSRYSKVSAARLMKDGKQPPMKGTKLQQNLGVSDEEIKRTVAVDYTIDVNKRKGVYDEPKLTK